jgi:hypothetical protein
VAIFALFYSGRQARAAKDAAVGAEDRAGALEDQTQLHRDLAKVAAKPRLWADIRGDNATGHVLVLLLGNLGPSIARNVKLMFDPTPTAQLDIKPVFEILERGIASMAPGPDAGVGAGRR